MLKLSLSRSTDGLELTADRVSHSVRQFWRL